MSYCKSSEIVGVQGTCDFSKGGIREVFIAGYKDDIYTVSDDGDVTAVDSGVTWYKYYIRKGSSSMTSTATIDSANGINYVQTDLALVFAKMDAAKRMALNTLLLADVAVVVCDANGVGHALGTEEPVNATAATSQSGTAVSDANNYQITLSDTTLGFAPTVESSVLEGIRSKAQ